MAKMAEFVNSWFSKIFYNQEELDPTISTIHIVSLFICQAILYLPGDSARECQEPGPAAAAGTALHWVQDCRAGRPLH